MSCPPLLYARNTISSSSFMPAVLVPMENARARCSGGVELAARLVSLEEGDSSSDAGCQVVDEGDDELLRHRLRFGDDASGTS
jgi:hypothetical protein